MSGEKLKALVLADDEDHQYLITDVLEKYCDIQTIPLPSTPEAARPDLAVLGPFLLINPEAVEALKTTIDGITQAVGGMAIPFLFLHQNSRTVEEIAREVKADIYLYWSGDLNQLEEKVSELKGVAANSQTGKPPSPAPPRPEPA